MNGCNCNACTKVESTYMKSLESRFQVYKKAIDKIINTYYEAPNELKNALSQELFAIAGSVYHPHELKKKVFGADTWRVARALNPILFGENKDAAHMVASPMTVESEQIKALEKAQEAVRAIYGRLAS